MHTVLKALYFIPDPVHCTVRRRGVMHYIELVLADVTETTFHMIGLYLTYLANQVTAVLSHNPCQGRKL